MNYSAITFREDAIASATGRKVGEMILYKDNVEFDRVPVVAAETAERANFADRFKAILRGWRFGKS